MLRISEKRVLVIEDHAEMRASLKSMMDRLGVRKVDVATHGDEGIEYLRLRAYDLILCDYDLGKGRDGQQVLEETRYAHLIKEGADYVMVTAAQTVEMVMGALEYHPDGYITKPVTFDDFCSRLRRIFKYKSFFQKINDAIDAKETELALRECDRLVMEQPKLALATYRIKGKLLFNAGNIQKAKEIYQFVLDTRELAWAVLGKCKCLYQEQKLDEAIPILETLVKKNDKYVECYDLLAKIYDQQGDLKKAQEILESAVEQSPKAILRQTELSRISTLNQDWQTAIKASRKAVSLGKNSCHRCPDNYINLAKSLQDQLINGGYRDKTYAANEISKTLELVRQEYPLDQQIHVKAALIEATSLKNQDKENEAKALVQIARGVFDTIAIPPSKEETQELVHELIAIGDTEETEAFLESAKQKNLLSDELHESLCQKNLETKEKKQQIKFESYNNKGVQYFESGKLQKAIEMFDNAMENEKASSSVVLNAVQALVVFMQKFGPDYESLEKCKAYLKRTSGIQEDDERYPRLQKLTKIYQQLKEG